MPALRPKRSAPRSGTAPEPLFNARRILVPIDFTPDSDPALEWAIRVAREEKNASLYLCHIFHGPVPPLNPDIVVFNYDEIEKKAAKKQMPLWQARVPKNLKTVPLYGQGPAANEIARLCGEHQIDLVVMVTHGRKGVSRLFMGSVAEETVRLAPCPVLVLHLPGPRG